MIAQCREMQWMHFRWFIRGLDVRSCIEQHYRNRDLTRSRCEVERRRPAHVALIHISTVRQDMNSRGVAGVDRVVEIVRHRTKLTQQIGRSVLAPTIGSISIGRIPLLSVALRSTPCATRNEIIRR